MRPSFLGLIVGLALGFAAAFGGFGAFLAVGVLGGIGFVVGKVTEGQIDLSQYLGGGGQQQAMSLTSTGGASVATGADVKAADAAADDPDSRGALHIADRVIEKIASQAASEVDRATGAPRRVLGVSLGGDTDRPRVSAKVDGDIATVDVSMSVAWPAPVLEVARQVRAHVQKQLISLAGLSSAEVDIEVTALHSGRSKNETRVH